uniref:ORFan n=1 Tax=Strongyloides venezuelensis TaxID=75913 RepID=A0A0K0FC90_STRVS
MSTPLLDEISERVVISGFKQAFGITIHEYLSYINNNHHEKLTDQLNDIDASIEENNNIDVDKSLTNIVADYYISNGKKSDDESDTIISEDEPKIVTSIGFFESINKCREFILRKIYSESVLTKNNEVEDSSEEIEKDKENLEITKKTTEILGKIYAFVFENDSDETDESVKKLLLLKPRKKKLKKCTNNNDLFQGDIILTKSDAETLIENAFNEVLYKQTDITKIESELSKIINNVMSDSDEMEYENMINKFFI